MHNRFIKAIVALSLALFVAGCAAPSASPTHLTPAGASPSPMAQVQATPSEAPTAAPTQPKEPQPLNFTWNPYVLGSLIVKAHGESIKTDAFAVIKAILAYESSAPCKSQEYMYTLYSVLRDALPPFNHLLRDFQYSKGSLLLSYRYGKDEHALELEKFEAQLGYILQGAVMEGDSLAAASIAIYRHYSALVTYDYSALEDGYVGDLSCYRGLMELSGICQTFSTAYAYLCLQYGIDAVTASGMNEAFEAHEWTLLTLNGKLYYADPTFENGMGAAGLRYFGMTAARREAEGGFIAAEYNIGNTNELWGRDIAVTDELFAPLWEAVTITEITRENGRMLIHCQREDGSAFVYTVQ